MRRICHIPNKPKDIPTISWQHTARAAHSLMPQERDTRAAIRQNCTNRQSHDMRSQATSQHRASAVITTAIAAVAGSVHAETFIGFTQPLSGPDVLEALNISVFELSESGETSFAEIATEADWAADIIVEVSNMPTPGIIDPSINITDANFGSFSIAANAAPAAASFGVTPINAAQVTVSNLRIDFIDSEVGPTQFFDAGVSTAVANQNGVDADIAGTVQIDMVDGTTHTIDLAQALGDVTIDLQGFYQLQQTDNANDDILQIFEITPIISFTIEIGNLDYLFSLQFDRFTLAATDVFTDEDLVPAIPAPGIIGAAAITAGLIARRRR